MQDITGYIEMFYNRERRGKNSGILCPISLEQK